MVIGEGETLEEAIKHHDYCLHALLKRCEERQIVFNVSENFCLRERFLPFVGHVFTDKGLQADPDKIEAICKMLAPSDVLRVRRFLGMVAYLMRFVPGVTDLTGPLRKLAHHDAVWDWSRECDNAMNKIKTEIGRVATLIYFDPTKKSVLQCGASSTGLGAVLMQDGAPIAFAS